MHTALTTAAIRAHWAEQVPAQASPAAKAAQVCPEGKELGSPEVSRGTSHSTTV